MGTAILAVTGPRAGGTAEHVGGDLELVELADKARELSFLKQVTGNQQGNWLGMARAPKSDLKAFDLRIQT